MTKNVRLNVGMRCRVWLACVLLAALQVRSHAQDYPSRPIDNIGTAHPLVQAEAEILARVIKEQGIKIQ